MEEWKLELIAEAIDSDAFPGKEKALYRSILEHLVEHSSPAQRHQRTERFLVEKFFPPGYGGNGAMAVKRLEHYLERFYASDEGRRQMHRMVLHRGKAADPAHRYSVAFVLSPDGVLRAFWRPYLARAQTIVAYGVPLFIRSADQQHFRRDATLNIPSDFKSANASEEICYPFVAHGDLLAAVDLERWLTAQQVRVNLAWFKATDRVQSLGRGPTTDEANVIAVGSIRVNGILDDYQRLELHSSTSNGRRNVPFRLTNFDVVRVDEAGLEIGRFEETHLEDRSTVPVVITRRAGAVRNRSTVTLIASNHGRAVARVAQILTGHELGDLLAEERLRDWATKLPETFQLVLRVTVPKEEDGALGWTLEDFWCEGSRR
jgi:hypothetical protein